MVRVAPDGSIRDSWVLDALPDASLSKDLNASLRAIAFTKGDGDADRYAVVPITFDDRCSRRG